MVKIDVFEVWISFVKHLFRCNFAFALDRSTAICATTTRPIFFSMLWVQFRHFVRFSFNWKVQLSVIIFESISKCQRCVQNKGALGAVRAIIVTVNTIIQLKFVLFHHFFQLFRSHVFSFLRYGI